MLSNTSSSTGAGSGDTVQPVKTMPQGVRCDCEQFHAFVNIACACMGDQLGGAAVSLVVHPVAAR